MKRQWKLVSILVGLWTLGCACGDIIRVPHSAKKATTPEAEEKTSAFFGRCVNFQGHWSAQCATPVSGIPETFFLDQLFCDSFGLTNPNRSFEREALSWSDARDTVTLRAENETILLTKQDGVRQGTWTRGDQTCTLRWAP